MKGLIAAVILGGVFGSASATVESIDEQSMIISLEVEVMGGASSVVAHLAFDEEPVLTLPLLDRGEGVFGLRTELEPKNYIVVFEVLDAEPESSGPLTLTQLGADLGPESDGSGTDGGGEEGLSPESRRLLWLAVALGAASLSVLAFWVLAGKDRGEGEDTAQAGESEEAGLGSPGSSEEE